MIKIYGSYSNLLKVAKILSYNTFVFIVNNGFISLSKNACSYGKLIDIINSDDDCCTSNFVILDTDLKKDITFNEFNDFIQLSEFGNIITSMYFSALHLNINTIDGNRLVYRIFDGFYGLRYVEILTRLYGKYGK